MLNDSDALADTLVGAGRRAPRLGLSANECRAGRGGGRRDRRPHRRAGAGRRRRLPVTVIEAADRFGGKIATYRVDGLVVEAGADSFLSTKPAGLALVERLGIGDRLVNSKAGDRRTFVWSRGRLRELPEGLVLGSPARAWSLLRSGLLSPPGAARLVGRRGRPPPAAPTTGRTATEETVAEFFTRRLGPEAYARVVEPLLAGIHAGDATRLSLPATFPRFVDMERDHGGLVRAALAGASPKAPVPLRRKGSVPGVRQPGANWRSLTGIRRKRNADSAGSRNGRDGSGGSDAVRFVPDRHGGTHRGAGRAAPHARRRPAHRSRRGGHPGGGRRVRGRPRRRRPLSRRPPWSWPRRRRSPPDSSGPVCPVAATAAGGDRARLDGHGVSGLPGATTSARPPPATASSSPGPRGAISWPAPGARASGRAGRPPEQVLVRGYVGGIGREAVLDADDDGLVHLVRAELGALAGIRGTPVHTEVHRYPLGMPQYTVGHLARVARDPRRPGCLPRPGRDRRRLRRRRDPRLHHRRPHHRPRRPLDHRPPVAPPAAPNRASQRIGVPDRAIAAVRNASSD